MYIYDDISLSSSEKVKMFQTTVVEKAESTFYVVCFLLGNSQASELRRRGISQKKAYKIQNKMKA